jgi:hypothetical protein
MEFLSHAAKVKGAGVYLGRRGRGRARGIRVSASNDSIN